MWKISEAEFPASGSPRDKLYFVPKYAALAPTESGWQPWEFQVTETHLELRAKAGPARRADEVDDRELVIGCGAALQHLKLALKHFGCLGRVELFPDLGEPALVARLHFGLGREKDAEERRLFEAMTRERRPGYPPAGKLISDSTLAALRQTVAGERGWLDFVQSELSRQYVSQITLAENEQSSGFNTSIVRPAPATWSGSLSRWPQALLALGGRAAVSRREAVTPVPRISTAAATLAVVKTKTDDKHGWLAAGMTMARAVLQVQALGYAWDFFNPVRQREAREALRTGFGHKGFAQIILQFGSLPPDDSVRLSAPTTVTRTSR